MKRRVVAILAAASLLNVMAVLSVGAIVLTGTAWLRSWIIVDKVSRTKSHYEIELFSYHGTLLMKRSVITVWGDESDPDRSEWLRGRDAARYADLRRQPSWGVTTSHGMSQGREWFCEDRSVGLPYWLIMLIASSPVCVWVVRRLRTFQVPESMCRKCGYDLRATPERCPECGAIATPTAA